MNHQTKLEQAHGEVERIFRNLLPQNGMAVREEQISLCHAMLDALFQNKIILCDAGTGIGKTYAYLTACILLQKFYPARVQPVLISTSSVALQDAIMKEYIPFLSKIFLENRIISTDPRCHPQGKGTFCLRRAALVAPERCAGEKEKRRTAKGPAILAILP